MLDKAFVGQFASEWIEAWNSHDLSRILEHYSDDFEMSSPLIGTIVGEASGRLKGKQTVGAYWQKCLQLNPTLHFELVTTLVGANSIVLYYKGSRGMSAEFLIFGPNGRVTAAFAHYTVSKLD